MSEEWVSEWVRSEEWVKSRILHQAAGSFVQSDIYTWETKNIFIVQQVHTEFLYITFNFRWLNTSIPNIL